MRRAHLKKDALEPGPGRLLRTLIGSLLLIGSPAWAQMTGNIEKLKTDLHGESIDRAVAAASALGSLKVSESLDALMGVLQLGTPPRLTIALLEAIEVHQDPKAIVLLRHFARNRRVEIRTAAIKAIGAINEPKITAILLDALGDNSPMVRARAARLLGDRKERRAEPYLFKMLKRGDKSAAVPLGTVAGVETAKQLSELIGDLPDDALAGALGTMLKRADFGPDPLRKEIVETLGKIPGAESTAELVEYIAGVPPGEIRLSKAAAEKILEGRQK